MKIPAGEASQEDFSTVLLEITKNLPWEDSERTLSISANWNGNFLLKITKNAPGEDFERTLSILSCISILRTW